MMDKTPTCPYCEAADYDCVELGKARKRIAAMEAELIATRREFARQGDICAICKHKMGDPTCDECVDLRDGMDTGEYAGFEWDGGAT